MKELAIDIETFSGQDIKAGVHKYVEHPNFEILLFAYSIDGGPAQVVDIASGEFIPQEIHEAMINPGILKTAYNAQFEISCLRKIWPNLDATQWSCTMALAAQAGLPFGLDMVAKVIKSDQQKDSKGKELLKYFTMPCKPTKTNGMRERNLPKHDFDKWLDFKSYAAQDVETEQGVRRYLSWFTVSEFEKDIWALDQKINHTGVLVDMQLVNNSLMIEEKITEILLQEMAVLANIDNPKSNAQVKDFILKNSGVEIKSLNKAEMGEIHKQFKDTEIGEVLKIRDKLSHAAIKKYTAMKNSAGKDNRIRGLFQYYGANRTGRWTSRNVQLQNLKRNDLPDLEFARQMVREGNIDTLMLTYDDVGAVLSNLVRTAFIPEEDKWLIVSDFSAIEARIVAWFANESWRLDVFKTHGKIYEASAAMMFNIPIESVTKDLRTKGKIAELALGYQGSVGAMEKMGGSRMGFSQEDMQTIVKKWRAANRKIVKHWYDVQGVVEKVLHSKSHLRLPHLDFYMKGKNLIIRLPSGRELVYIDAKYTGDNIIYYGMNQMTKQWGVQETYGGKLVENIVQAAARDVLTDAMVRVDKAGHKIIMHVHDEVVVESREDASDEITQIFRTPIPWAPGLPLGAETFKTKFYQK